MKKKGKIGGSRYEKSKRSEEEGSRRKGERRENEVGEEGGGKVIWEQV
jgi:hypothetical protein